MIDQGMEEASSSEEEVSHVDSSTVAAPKPLLSQVWPSPRMNAMMAVVGSMLYLLGGTLETGDRQVCYNYGREEKKGFWGRLKRCA